VTAVLLAPGAGATREQSTLVALDHALTQLGMTVVRMDFPYRKTGRRAPDREPVLLDAVREEYGALPKGQKKFLGGRSMGGRICSMAVAAGLKADGLILISYPLHPPGQPAKLRTAHFPDIHVPCLFVSGTRDTFGTRDEMEAATKLIHGLRNCDPVVVDAVTAWLQSLRKKPQS
jgi:hypothetical protein